MRRQLKKSKKQSGFTLIEMSIVLVIIGLIVGGVLVGRDLISAAAVRAQISQIEKYNLAVNTFREKYGYLPGDIPNPYAPQFGFASRGQYTGEGDGNGTLEAIWKNADGGHYGSGGAADGEVGMFWVDLSKAGLIPETFNSASPTAFPGGFSATILSQSVGLYMPSAKIGNENYVYPWSEGISGGDQLNYYDIAVVKSIGSSTCSACAATTPGLTVKQAHDIDQKMDDGLPQLGNIMALYISNTATPYNWASGGSVQGNGQWYNDGEYGSSATHGVYGPTKNATPGNSTTCYDNGNTTGQTQQYSMEISGGSNVNCALSFKFQ